MSSCLPLFHFHVCESEDGFWGDNMLFIEREFHFHVCESGDGFGGR
jgi:hypothetical protein